MIVSLIPKPVPHVSPILLLHMGVVIAAIRAAAGVEDRCPTAFLTPPQHMPIDELSTVVTVQPQPGEGQLRFDVFELLQSGFLASSIHRPHLHPGGADVDIVQHPCLLYTSPSPRDS